MPAEEGEEGLELNSRKVEDILALRLISLELSANKALKDLSVR